MNLREVVDSLEAKDVQLALDLGVHQHCLIDSNCPKAIELRKLIGEAGIGLPEILEGYQAITAPDPVDWSGNGFHIDGRVTIRVANQDLHLDLTQQIESQLTDQMRRRLDTIRQQENRIKELGSSLYASYLDEIARQRRTRVLPQLSFPLEELIRYNIMVTAQENNYIFLSPATYHPEYIVKDGMRYELSARDKASLRREVFFKSTVTGSNRFLEIEFLDMDGQFFNHYHGRRADCWGNIQLPATWGRTLRMLDETKIRLINSLITINYNSILSIEPPGMPHVNQLLERATELGREGVIDEAVQSGARIGQQENRTHWGRT